MAMHTFSLGVADLDRASRSRPHTPPFTPSHSKVRRERADSPASSIHPTETVSPAKKFDTRNEVPDTIIVQELIEGHPDYPTNIELVYPGELEEAQSASDMSDVSESEAEQSDMNITSRLRQLQCEDNVGEAKMRRTRRERRLSKRVAYRTYKRSHSQSIKSDSEATDAEAMDDHDLASTARRLRRRTQGPPDTPTKLNSADDALQSSPQVGSPSDRGARIIHDVRYQRRHQNARNGSFSDAAMDTSD